MKRASLAVVISGVVLLGSAGESSSATRARPYNVRPTAKCLVKKGVPHLGAEGIPQLVGVLFWKTRGRGAIELFFAETPFGATRYMKTLVSDLQISWRLRQTEARRVVIRRGNVDVETHNSAGHPSRPTPGQMATIVACLPPLK